MIAALAHGGLAGAIAEGFVAVAVVGIFVAVWLRERGARRRRRAAEVSDAENGGA